MNVFKTRFSTQVAPNVQENRDKIVGYWMFGTGALVYGIVVVGGLTRLTESGLSIVDWRPISGSIPPTSQSDWEIEFEKYKNK